MITNNSHLPLKLYDIDTEREIILESGDTLDVMSVEIKDGKQYVKLKESYLTNDGLFFGHQTYLKG